MIANNTHEKINNMNTNSDILKDFYPATTNSFLGQCGDVACVTASDFDDEYRRRHLESFKNSWDEWETYNKKKRFHEVDEKVNQFIEALIEKNPQNKSQFKSLLATLRKIYRVSPSVSEMILANENYKNLNSLVSTCIDPFLIRKSVRTHSGVVVITILTSPGTFSCRHDCHYCPNEPGQPRSYLSTEPAVLRANQNGWDAATQFWDRAETLHNNGHLIDKIEIIVLGGTWSGYPPSYQEQFIRDIFFAANVFNLVLNKRSNLPRNTEEAALPFIPAFVRDRYSLEEEQKINQSAESRIIGLTLETRPDHISLSEIKRLRRFGCTRVQIGIQHTNDTILNTVNRNCTLAQAIKAIHYLKDSCYKVDIHLMLDLPGSSPQLDKDMLELVLSDEALQVDQWKIYPCEVTPFSRIEEWYKNKEFVPYSDINLSALIELIIKAKIAMHPWIRLNRIIRDIPNPSIIGGNSFTNLRQILVTCMNKCGLTCRCIRCREIQTKSFQIHQVVLKIRKYPSKGGIEFFISYETEDESTLFGFLRLRIRYNDIEQKNVSSDNTLIKKVLPELNGCGLIRELHIYGKLVGSEEKKKEEDNRPQHSGIGKKLLCISEVITLTYGLKRMAVIAGVGTIEYYKKFGYNVDKYYMTKEINIQILKDNLKLYKIELPLTVQCYGLETKLGCIQSNAKYVEKSHAQVKNSTDIYEIVQKLNDVSLKSKILTLEKLNYNFETFNKMNAKQNSNTTSTSKFNNYRVVLGSVCIVLSFLVYKRYKKTIN